MKIGLIGGNGFLGSYIIKEAHSKGYLVSLIQTRKNKVNSKILFIKESIEAIKLCDYVINCAAAKKPKNKFDKFINQSFPKFIQNYIYKNKLKCKLIHISTINVLFDFLQDDYTKQKKIGENKLLNYNTFIIRPSLIWSWKGEGESKIIDKYLSLSLPFHFMINPGNLYRPIQPEILARFILNLISAKKKNRVFNVIGNKTLSLWDLTYEYAIKKNRKIYKIHNLYIEVIKLFRINRIPVLKTLMQQIYFFDRTTDEIKSINKTILNFSIYEN